MRCMKVAVIFSYKIYSTSQCIIMCDAIPDRQNKVQHVQSKIMYIVYL